MHRYGIKIYWVLHIARIMVTMHEYLKWHIVEIINTLTFAGREKEK